MKKLELDQALPTQDQATVIESIGGANPLKNIFTLRKLAGLALISRIALGGLHGCTKSETPSSTDAKPVAKESPTTTTTETQNPVDAMLNAVDPSKDTKRKLNDRLEAEATVRNQTGTNIGQEALIKTEELKNNKKQ